MYLGGHRSWVPLFIGRTRNTLLVRHGLRYFFWRKPWSQKKNTDWVNSEYLTIVRPHYALAQTLVPVKCTFLFCQEWLSNADQVNWGEVICELRTEELNAPYFTITQSVVSKQHHSLKCRRIRLCNKAHLLKRIWCQMMSLSFKKRQFLLVRAVGRNGKGYTMGRIRSLVVDEVNRQIWLF